MPNIAQNILVTGGAGYIGSVLVPRLLHNGYRVTVIDNLMYKQISLFGCCHHDKFTFVRGDVRDTTLMNIHVAKADIIIPLAAIVGAPACNKDVNVASEVNWNSFSMLNQLLSRDQLVLYPNTNSGYGIGSDELCTEESPLNPISSYGRHKVLVEKLLLERENTIVFRFATVFGMSPRMRLDLLVNDFVYKAVTDGYIVLYEDHFRRNYIHIQDVVRVFFHGIAEWYRGARSEVYNVGLSDANLTKKQLCQKIKEHRPELLWVLSGGLGSDPDKRDYYVSNEKIEKTGWECKFSLDMGIEELIKGYKMMSKEYSNA